MMKISIAMTTYNGAKYLQEQLDSFVAQTRQPDELVVCDDCSTDSTHEILEAFRQQAPFVVRIYRNEMNLGYIKNFQKALLLCTGDIIFLSDQDDVWFPEKLKVMINLMESNPVIQVLLCDMMLADDDLRPTIYTQLGNILASGGKQDHFMSGCGTALRQEWVDIVFPIPAELCGHDNWIHRLAIALGVRNVIEVPLQHYRRHGQNASKWLLSNPRSISKMDVFWSQRFQDASEGWQREIDRIMATIHRIEHSTIALSWLGLENHVPGGVARLKAEIIDREYRILIVGRSRLLRIPGIIRLWSRGGYHYFAGWKSAIKDLLRPSPIHYKDPPISM